MCKKSRFGGPLDKQHGRRAKPLLKSVSQHLDHIHRSRPKKLNWERSRLLTWQILRLYVNMLAAYEKYLVLHRDNSTIQIQMQLSQKEKTISQFLLHF